VPAWRPVVHKGVSRLIIHIREEINTMQYDNPNTPDVGEVFGSVICKVLLIECLLVWCECCTCTCVVEGLEK